MPIVGLEGEERKHDIKEAAQKRMQEKVARHEMKKAQERRQEKKGEGTLSELAGPDWAPYNADPEWDGLGRRASTADAVKKAATKPKTVPKTSKTAIVGPTSPGMFNWQGQVDAFMRQLKAMFGKFGVK